MSKISTAVKGESYTYRVLWQASKHQLRLAEQIEDGSMYCYLAAMVMAYFAYEAYLNYLGSFIAPDAWKNEKTFFSQEEYYGIEGKLKIISEKINKVLPDKSKRPYQSIRMLQRLRNKIAHGKQDHFSFSVKHAQNEHPRMVQSEIGKLVSKGNAERCIADVKEFIEFLHQNARNTIHDPRLGREPFSGFLAAAMGSPKEIT